MEISWSFNGIEWVVYGMSLDFMGKCDISWDTWICGPYNYGELHPLTKNRTALPSGDLQIKRQGVLTSKIWG